MSASAYTPVSATDVEPQAIHLNQGEHEDEDNSNMQDDESNNLSTAPVVGVEPLEIEMDELDDEEEYLDVADHRPHFEIFSLPSLFVTFFLSSPVLLLSAWTFYQFIGRSWIATPFILHWFVSLLSARLYMAGFWKLSSACGLLDILFFLVAYKTIYTFVIEDLFTDIDGTPVIEWAHDRRAIQMYGHTGVAIAVSRLVIGSASITARGLRYFAPTGYLSFFGFQCISRYCSGRLCMDQTRHRLARSVQQVTMVALVIAGALLTGCLVSVLVHFVHWPSPPSNGPSCDPIDPTECWLPFPSFHHMQRDLSTETGWRVNLRAEVLPRLKGGIEMDPHWLNELDGFSTMGPILFYVEGLKEAHEAGQEGLQGSANLEISITQQSITLLLDVNASQLVPHSAEIDYLDVRRPQVMLFPAYPLRHANHYAVAVVNATDALGMLLKASEGMTDLLAPSKSKDNRHSRYMDVVLPALEEAAPWFSLSNDIDSLQLLFDFVTASEQSQLGHVRAVRDATLAIINSAEWDWQEHHREIQRVNYDCDVPGTLLARTVHGEIDVPWFLDCFGPGCRGSFLNETAVRTGDPTTIGSAKYILHIPCSLRAGALGLSQGKPLVAVMEFGHGLFGNRAESFDRFLQQLAHDEGYAVTAMDWRGMCSFDLLIVGKMLLARPRLFRAVRDNLMQGYANKFALQHFFRNGEQWKADSFSFQDSDGHQTIVQTDRLKPSFVFYGISQGGILGAGYVSLSKGLIDRAVLGVPGTPFALVMSRSHDFIGYDTLMLLDLYDNRQVRMLLALCQMGWDSFEGAGVLATPVTEPFPPLLMQAGLGDAVVPTIAAEALARGFRAVLLPNNPRQDIFGVPVDSLATEKNHRPLVVLTEAMYENEYLSLPVNDILGGQANAVHDCVRRDRAMIGQVAAFISDGRIIDPCLKDGCIRENAHC